MICGIDVGSILIKAIVLDEKNSNDIVLQEIGKSIGNPEESVTTLINNIRKKLRLKKRDLQIAFTGRNCENLTMNPKIAELNCLAEGIHTSSDHNRIIVDIGGFTNKIIKIDETGRIMDYLMNNICSSGSGVFISLICKSLGIDIMEIDTYAFKSEHPHPISSQCSIFAETEVIYLMNEGKQIEDIVAGACKSITGRLIPLILKIGREINQVLMLTGGLAKSEFIKQDLMEQLHIEVKNPSIDPIFTCAYGCARSLQNTSKEEI
ncbi:MAG: hypothetical protein JW776_16590 [Candidatus Lokiarchaeota archaeon]|nr:hypothetical protein [Candidatus Lokiarchaeota archaeon]